jgi:hypothetical protein
MSKGVRVREHVRQPWGSVPRSTKCFAPEKSRGTVNGYINYLCRCPLCREAWRVYCKERRERRARLDEREEGS